jgi:hypothetical protein
MTAFSQRLSVNLILELTLYGSYTRSKNPNRLLPLSHPKMSFFVRFSNAQERPAEKQRFGAAHCLS